MARCAGQRNLRRKHLTLACVSPQRKKAQYFRRLRNDFVEQVELEALNPRDAERRSV